ncbi:MAG: hypothetical protein AB8B79_20245 [Granulosicoccus sp.]
MNVRFYCSKTAKRWAVALAGCFTMLATPVITIAAHSADHVSVATLLTEVQRGTFDGRDFLTLHIGEREVGPSSCRSNILRMDSYSEMGAERQEEIETIALTAMLSADTVMIVVPLGAEQCVDGKPTFTDLYLLPASP